jgi:hypothetical protein
MFNNELSSTLRNTTITTSYIENYRVGFDLPLKTTTTLTTTLLLT